MSRLLCAGSILKCSCGNVPTPLAVLPTSRVVTGVLPVATIMDNKPFLNIMPFGLCSSPTNPAVIAATSAAMGVFTPAPCLPSIPAPWITTVPTVHIGGKININEGSQLMCLYGGMIKSTTSAQYSVMVP